MTNTDISIDARRIYFRCRDCGYEHAEVIEEPCFTDDWWFLVRQGQCRDVHIVRRFAATCPKCGGYSNEVGYECGQFTADGEFLPDEDDEDNEDSSDGKQTEDK